MANMLKLSFLVSLLTSLNSGLWPQKNSISGVGISPPTCDRIECPNFETLHDGDGFEIRRYNSSMWVTTSPIQDISLVDATRTGFLLLFDYIQGKNSYGEKIEMTAPVITEVSPSDGPFCESSFSVSFYVPKKNQANPAPAKGLHIQSWKTTHVAVRQFDGFVSDYQVGEEAAALEASIAGTPWAEAVRKNRPKDRASAYIVAQYNSPFEFENRVNEIWMLFDLENST